MAKATICPLQNLGKNLERKHTWRNLVQYRNCQLNQNMHGKYILSHIVRSKFILKSRFSYALLNTYASCSTKRGEHTCQSLHHVTLLWTWLVPGRLHTRDTAQGEIRTEKGCASGDGSSVLLLRALHAYMKTTGWVSVWTTESFFASNRSQTESEKNDTEEEQCINEAETNKDHGCAMKRRQCSAIFVGNLWRQTP